MILNLKKLSDSLRSHTPEQMLIRDINRRLPELKTALSKGKTFKIRDRITGKIVKISPR